MCADGPENELHFMAKCEVAHILWFRLMGLHLQQFNFFDPLEFLAIVTFVTNKLGPITNLETQNRVIAAAAIILKRTWEARCDFIFNDIPIDIGHIATLVDNDLLMKLSHNLQQPTEPIIPHARH